MKSPSKMPCATQFRGTSRHVVPSGISSMLVCSQVMIDRQEYQQITIHFIVPNYACCFMIHYHIHRRNAFLASELSFKLFEKYGKVVHESMNISCFEKIQCTNQLTENGKM